MCTWIPVLFGCFRSKRWKFGLVLAVLLGVGVSGLGYSLTQAQSGTTVTFIEVAQQLGMVVNTYSWGLAWADYDNDDFVDLYSNNHTQGPALFRNNGGLSFTEVANQLGLLDSDLHGPAWGDYDNDGDVDLYQNVGALRPDFFYHNNGTGPFILITPALDTPGASGRGVAWADYDRDGDLDLLLINISKNGFRSELFQNQGNGTFVIKTDDAGLASGITGAQGIMWGDYNNDGWLDLLAYYPDVIRLFRNNGDGSFTNRSSLLDGVMITPRTIRQVDWVDYDNDDDLDLYVSRGHRHDGLTWNNNEIKWITDVSSETGFDFKPNSPNDPILFDIHDLCGGLDDQQIFIGASEANPSSSVFTLSTGGSPNPNGQPTYTSGTGGVFIWVDGGGWWRLRANGQRSSGRVIMDNGLSQVTSLNLPVNPSPTTRNNELLENKGGEVFVNVTTQANATGGGRQTYGTVWGDFNNDGYLDVYLVNGGHFVNNEPDTFLINNGNKTFSDTTTSAGLGTVQATGYGDVAAAADYNRDGFLDIAVANGGDGPGPCGGPLQLFKNQGNNNHWLDVKIIGTVSNRDGIGAYLTLRAGGATQYRQHLAGQHRDAQDSALIHFGLGQATIVESLVITWPSGLVESYSGLNTNQVITLVEGSGPLPPTATPPAPGPGTKLMFLPLILKNN